MAESRQFSGNTVGDYAKIFQGNITNVTNNFDVSKANQKRERDEEQKNIRDEEVRKALRIIINAEPRIPIPVDHRRKLEDKKGKVLSGTCGWLHNHTTFKTFISSDNDDILWIHGNPGKGKSMLALSLIDQLASSETPIKMLKDVAVVNMPICCYFFFAYDDDRIRTPVALMRSILYQLLERRPDLVIHIMQDLEREAETLFTQPEAIQACWRILIAMMRSSSYIGRIYFLVDALDECELESRTAWLQNLVEEVKSRQRRQQYQLKMKWIIISRSNELDIPETLGSGNGFSSICLEENAAAIEKDVLCYIEAQKKTFPKRHTETEKAAIGRALLENSEGTFLWIWLACEQIRKARPGLVDAVLKRPPKGLDDFYQRMLDSVDEDAQDIAASILQVVLYAARPFTLEQLAIASGVATTDEEANEDTALSYIELCGSFLDIERSTGTVTLIQKSARTFLLQGMEAKMSKRMDMTRWRPEEAHLVLTERCYNYLHNGALASCKSSKAAQSSTEDYSDSTKVAARYPFLAYAISYWMYHARLASCSSSNSGSISRVTKVFGRNTEFLKVGDSEIRSLWCQQYTFSYLNWASRASKPYTPLQIACRGGIVPLVIFLLDRGDDIEEEDAAGNTALHHAAWEGHDDVIAVLLERGAKTGSKDKSGRSILHLVALQGHKSTAELLLNKGADELLCSVEEKNGMTPLHCAVNALHEDVMRILVERATSASLPIDARDKRGHTPLHYTSCWGFANTPQRPPSPKWRGGGTSCSSGISSRDARRLWLKSVTIPDNDEDDIKGGCYDDLLRILIEMGADVEAVDSFGCSALHLAVFAEQEYAMQLLLEFGKCNPSPRDERGWTPLMWAVDDTRISICRRLLEFNADIHATNEEDFTALHLATLEKNVDMIQMLLQFGADPCTIGKDGTTPLYSSSHNGPPQVAALMIEKASNLNLPYTKSGDTPLMIAIERLPLVAEMLIEAGCDLNSQNKAGMTPIQIAVQAGRRSVTRLLIDRGVDVKVIDNLGGTLLHIAADKEHAELVQMLLKEGFDPTAKDNEGATPLHDAAGTGSVAVATLLVEAGADVNAVCERRGGTALGVCKKARARSYRDKDFGPIIEYLEKVMDSSPGIKTSS